MRRLVVRPRLAHPRARTSVAVAATLTALALGATACGESAPAEDAAADATATTTPTSSPATTPSEETPSTTATTTPASPSPTAPTPTVSPQAFAAAAARGPVGTWRNREMKWVLRIRKGGRFVEDFDGVKNIRSGTWRRKGRVVVLAGGDGITTRGKLTRNTLTIRGTVLKRVR